MNRTFLALTLALALSSTTRRLIAQIDFLPVDGDTSPSAPQLADVVDFDGDWDRDILATVPRALWVYPNNNSARLSPPQRIPVSFPSGPRSVRAYQLDQDMTWDLVAYQVGGPELRAYLQRPGVTFQSTYTHLFAQPIQHVVAGDVTGDLLADLVVQTTNTVEVFANQGSGTFQSIATFPHAGLDEIFLTDQDGDGDADVLASGGGSTRLFFLENRGGTLVVNTNLTVPATNVLAAVFDFDVDGYQDLVLVSDAPTPSPRTVTIAYGSATGHHLVTVATLPADEVGSFFVDDFQFATDFDLSWFTGTAWYVFEGQPNRMFQVYEVPSNPRWPGPVTLQRSFLFDEDLDPDLVVGTPQGFTIMDCQVYADVVHCPFNETRGQTTANLGARAWASRDLTVTVPNWQGDPGRRNYRGNDRGYGCLASPHGGVVTGQLQQDFPSPYLTVAWWQRFPAGAPTQERTVFELNGFVTVVTGGPLGRELLARIPAGTTCQTTGGTFQPGEWHHVILEVFGLSPTSYLSWQIDRVPGPSVAHASGLQPPRSGIRFGIGGNAQGQNAATTHLDLDDVRIHDDVIFFPGPLDRMMQSEGDYVLDLGGGCSGAHGVNALQIRGVPRPGNQIEFALENASQPYVILLGASTVQWLGVPLPVPLGNGCSLDLSPDLVLTGFQPRVVLPNLPVTNRGHVYVQALVSGAWLSTSSTYDVIVSY